MVGEYLAGVSWRNIFHLGEVDEFNILNVFLLSCAVSRNYKQTTCIPYNIILPAIAGRKFSYFFFIAYFKRCKNFSIFTSQSRYQLDSIFFEKSAL